MRIKPFGRKLYCRKCLPGKAKEIDGDKVVTSGGIILPSAKTKGPLDRKPASERSWWFRILSVADDCTVVDKDYIGWCIIVPEFEPRYMHPVDFKNDWMVSERMFEELPDGQVCAALFKED